MQWMRLNGKTEKTSTSNTTLDAFIFDDRTGCQLRSIMPLLIRCPKCQMTLQVADNSVGKQFRCASCKYPFLVGVAPRAKAGIDATRPQAASTQSHPVSWKDRCLSFVKKYGKVAKTVASGVLNVVAPGSGSLMALVDLACDTAQDHWEAKLLQATQNNTAELQRLGQLFELLSGDLAGLCDKAVAFADQPDELPDILARTLAADPSLSRGLHTIETIKSQFEVFRTDLRRIARNQEDALPVYARMHRVCDYFDELWAHGITPRDFAQQVHCQREVAARIVQGKTTEVDRELLELRTAAPKAASVCILEAAAATREHKYHAAQRALATAVRLRPGDAELAELSRRVTVLAMQTTARQRPSPNKPQHPRLQIGDILDGWLLEARLGAGGWGQVFRASRDGQARAIKVMHPEYAADAAFVARFKKEIAALLRLPRHPNLVGIEAGSAFGYCTGRSTWYLAMEYVDGPTLESYLAAKGPLNEGHVRKVFPDVIAGLSEAHKFGIIHRDIKPGNLIFRRQDSRLVLVDFGLAVGVEEMGQTKVGGISILFAAPEQHYGEPATQASDVFSLCAVIHYALNYDKPEMRKPNRFTPGIIPESLRAALAQGMKPNADERWRDAGQLLTALKAQHAAKEVKQQRQGKIGQFITNKLGMHFAWVPPGDSWLGGGDGKPGTIKYNLPQGLWCGIHPVTQAEWEAVMGSDPSHFSCNPRYPVENVSCKDVQQFIKKLSQQYAGDGLVYRLPTECEWEYICRGGPISQEQSMYNYYFARSKTDLTPNPSNNLERMQANFGNSIAHTTEVCFYLPNPLGIYDMHGNVWEWTSSQVDLFRVFRGGGWGGSGAYCTASSRDWGRPDRAFNFIGFRLLAVPSGK